VVVPLAFLLVAGEGAYRLFWVLFGTSNQLLAALSLLGVSVWLRRAGRTSAFTLLPMAFVMTITVWSLVLQVRTAARELLEVGPRLDAVVINGIVSLLLLVLALVLVGEAVRTTRAGAPAAAPAGAA
jgi:carbon starvation protein